MNSRANEPHGIQYIAVLGDPQQFVRHGDRVHVTVLAVVEVSIGTPDPLEHFDAETERLDRAQKAQARVAPRLPEVTVHRVILERMNVQTGPNSRSIRDDQSAKSRLYRKTRFRKQRPVDIESGGDGKAAFQPRYVNAFTRVERNWNARICFHPRVA